MLLICITIAPMLAKLGEIELERLPRQQVSRDRIGAERVEDQKVVARLRLTAERDPRIAEDDAVGATYSR